MLAQRLSPITAGNPYLIATSSLPTNHTVIIVCAIAAYTDDTYMLSWSDVSLDYHVRITAAGQLRLGRFGQSALNIWTDSYTGLAAIVTYGNVAATASRFARYRRAGGSWVDAGSISHGAVTATELLIGNRQSDDALGQAPIDYLAYMIYDRQLTQAEYEAVGDAPVNRPPPVTSGLVFRFTAEGGPMGFGQNEVAGGLSFSRVGDQAGFVVGPEYVPNVVANPGGGGDHFRRRA